LSAPVEVVSALPAARLRPIVDAIEADDQTRALALLAAEERQSFDRAERSRCNG
jgi:hypothetical protein